MPVEGLFEPEFLCMEREIAAAFRSQEFSKCQHLLKMALGNESCPLYYRLHFQLVLAICQYSTSSKMLSSLPRVQYAARVQDFVLREIPLWHAQGRRCIVRLGAMISDMRVWLKDATLEDNPYRNPWFPDWIPWEEGEEEMVMSRGWKEWGEFVLENYEDVKKRLADPMERCMNPAGI